MQKLMQRLDVMDNKDIVIALGYTGCGKSSMLNSLLLGPESLEKQKNIIELKTGQSGFEIGHSQKNSMTFLPVLKQSIKEPDLYYVDIAGFNDSGGDTIEFINCFMCKSIF